MPGCILTRVSLFRVNVVASNPKDEARATSPLPVLVDTGSELTWLPATILVTVGIEPRRKRLFTTATGVRVERTVGYAVLAAEGHETVDEVVFAEPGDLSLLGVRTLEGFGVAVDPLGHRLVAVSTIAAGSQRKDRTLRGHRRVPGQRREDDRVPDVGAERTRLLRAGAYWHTPYSVGPMIAGGSNPTQRW